MSELQTAAHRIARRLIDDGHTTYFAGGCVRDALLEKTPKDYDLATSATPDEVQALFPKSNAIGAHFGVILVKEAEYFFEIASFRHDGSYTDGRHPDSVTFSTPEEDAQRRDFTVNGLFQDPLSGRIIDYVGGQNDLKTKTLRAIGEPSQRFQEDALRLMRAIRFATVLNFEIEPSTWQAIHDHAELLGQISKERIREEFVRILLAPSRARGFELLTQSGLMHHIIPEVYDLIGCEQPPQWHPEGDVYQHTRIMLDMLKQEPSEALALAVVLHDIGKPATYSYDPAEDRIRFNGHDRVGAEMSESILRRLKCSNQTIEAVQAMVANHMNFMNVQKMRTAKVKRFMARTTFEDEMELHRVDCASSNGLTDNYDFLRLKEEEFAAEPLIPTPLVTGKDLIDLGLTPGPHFKEILASIQTEQLEGRLHDREQALEWTRKSLMPHYS
ncbi:CCA tRNA nucleotidyltransferase [Verrucomicrobiaceae bacterium N1E253]|uniref:CCA tRNA nucleotidyltransferase n=1 Tax=Oceaniferula marina TaxID=2748318 RepID=A0A851GM45_9BACT|nr:HD domain-containing protein [Oceaniferula marina]NWK56225.1 CCA tRNA nucleotidyltransferase [Oceaniferula marina]